MTTDTPRTDAILANGGSYAMYEDLCRQLERELAAKTPAPEAAPPRDIAQELIAGLEEVRDMRKCKKCEYPNCFCVQPQPQETRS